MRDGRFAKFGKITGGPVISALLFARGCDHAISDGSELTTMEIDICTRQMLDSVSRAGLSPGQRGLAVPKMQ